MKYFTELMGWIAGFLKEMLDNFREILRFYDNSKAQIDDAMEQMSNAG